MRRVDNNAPRLKPGTYLYFAVVWLGLVMYQVLNLSYYGLNNLSPYLAGLDDNCYYAYAHSLYFDGDLNFSNQYQVLADHGAPYTRIVFEKLVLKSPGKPENIFFAGTGVAAIPFLAVMEVLCSLLAWLGLMAPVTAVAPIYTLAYLLANITYGLAGLLVSANLLRQFGPGYATVPLLATVLCGPVLYSLLYAPGMSHLTSLFFNSLALWAWLQWRSGDAARKCLWACLCGAAIGFAICVRPYNLPMGLLLLERTVSLHYSKGQGLERLKQLAIAGTGAFIGFLPQLLVWKHQHGAWVVNTVDYQWRLLPPYFLHVLFGRRHGVFFWSPAFLLAMAGLLYALRKGQKEVAWLLAVLAGVTFMYGNWRMYWLGVSFGMRGYTDFAPIFAYGFGWILVWLRTVEPQRFQPLALKILALLAIVNVHLMIAFRSGAVSSDGPLFWLASVSDGKAYKARLRMEWRVLTDFKPDARFSLLKLPGKVAAPRAPGSGPR